MIVFEKSSGNLFQDLDIPDADIRFEKSNLAYTIFRTIKDLGLSQRKAANIMGVKPSDVSSIVRGHLQGFSVEQLRAFSGKLETAGESK